MPFKDVYLLWSQKVQDEELLKELDSIKDNEKEIEDRFYKDLEFGTAGLRGIMGAGSNRMNEYTVAKTTQGYSEYLLHKFKNPKVAIGYDTRKNSLKFAKLTASVFSGNGIKVTMFEKPLPTPMLSYAIRKNKLNGGVMVTASHNPSEYNGYKVFDKEGCQISTEEAEQITEYILKTNIFDGINTADFDAEIENKNIVYFREEFYNDYMSKVLNTSMKVPGSPIKIVYTPLNGVGSIIVREILWKAGYQDVSVVKEQEVADSNFTTCPYPNPENADSLKLGIKLMQKINADILIATDPDCDRMAVAVRHKGEVRLLSGNEVGVLFLIYLVRAKLEKNEKTEGKVVVKSIVTTDLINIISKDYEIRVKEGLTGFKNLAPFIDKVGDSFLFAFEESIGYIISPFVRDKDGCQASLLAAEMCSYFKKKRMTLVDVLEETYKEYGCILNFTENFKFEGSDGKDKMEAIMSFLRNDMFFSSELKPIRVKDYLNSIDFVVSNKKKKNMAQKKSDVLAFYFENGNKLMVRPSGTEPKLKLYYTVKGKTEKISREIYTKISGIVAEYLKLDK